MRVLVVAEHRAGELRPVTLEAIGAGTQLGEVDVLVVGPDALAQAVNVQGVSEIVAVAAGTEFDPDLLRRVVSEVAEERSIDVVLLGNTVDAMSYAAAVAIDGGRGFVSDVFALKPGLVATRSVYAGKVDAEVAIDGHAVVLIRPGAFEPATGAGSATLTSRIETRAARVRHLETIQPDDGGLDLAQQRFLLAIGRGIGEESNVELFTELANSMGATLASSRPLVDSGWMPSSRLVGQSGATVKPAVYLAFGISGAIQHLAGMKASETIIAVNHDPEASIFNLAHFGAVADIFDVAEELAKLY